MRYSIAISAQDAPFEALAYRGDLRAQLAELAELGFDGVELAIREPALVDGHALEKLLARHGLEVAAVSSGLAFLEDGLSLASADGEVRRVAIDRLLSHIPLAARLRSVMIIGLIATGTVDGQPVADATEQVVAGLSEVAGAAHERGVRLAVEPINRYESAFVRTVEDGLALIERVGAPNAGLLLDTFHMNIEEVSIEDSIRRAGERIFHFHVADSNRRNPGAGHIDFRSVLGALAGSGYDGWVSGEFLPLPDSRSAARGYLDHMRELNNLPREETTR
jgi:sugar phosphate isomerase/epimerase